ncbi:MAG TPA: lipid A deacylase LpxR family protein [Thermoanaerobaculia bacterium]|nr:lipid A deacylase LpxR family protein [Thermoanaerobaculia bacterium]
MRKTLGLLLLLAAVPASAAWKFNSWTVYWENDNFGIGRKSDRFYTNGVRISAQFTDNTIVNWRFVTPVRDWTWNHLGGIDGVTPIASVSAVFGQNFYTPENITIAAPQPFDRPWAGVLYAGVAESITDPDFRQMHVFEVDAGILGPGAGAQRVQKFVHNTLGFSDKDPSGWHNQLDNEPVLSLRYLQLRRFVFVPDTVDLVPEFGAMLGSPQTNANAGATLRLGYHVTGFPIGVINNAASPNPVHRYEVYVFGGAYARYVPYNATLDGAPDPKELVHDLRAGFSARYKRWRLTYTVIERSAEFDVPLGAIENQRFGSFALTFEPFTNFK